MTVDLLPKNEVTSSSISEPLTWDALRQKREHIFEALRAYKNEYAYRFSFLILTLITVAELLTLLPEPRPGMLLHGVTIMVLFYHLLKAEESAIRRLIMVLFLMPLIRIISFGLPLTAWPQISWYFAASIPLFGGIMLIIQQESWSREELGFTLDNLPLQAVVMLGGLALGWMEYVILQPEPLVSELTWQAIWLPALILLICTGYFEELLFRGLLQSAAISVIGYWPGLLFQAALFAVLHIGYASIIDVIFVFLVGFLFGLVVARTHSLLGVTLAHGLTNIGLFLLWPFWLG